MPLPKPRKDESKSAFVSRCTGALADKSEFKTNKQRVAVCYTQWRESKEMEMQNLTYAYVDEQMALLPHHTEDIVNGHSHKSVDVEKLREAIANVKNVHVNDGVLTQIIGHLSNHAKFLDVTEAESLEDREHRIRVSYYKQFASDNDDYAYIVDIYDDHVVCTKNGMYYKMSMDENSDGTFKFGDAVRVEKVYTEIVAATESEETDNTLSEIATELKAVVEAINNVPAPTPKPEQPKVVETPESYVDRLRDIIQQSELNNVLTRLTLLESRKPSARVKKIKHDENGLPSEIIEEDIDE